MNIHGNIYAFVIDVYKDTKLNSYLYFINTICSKAISTLNSFLTHTTILPNYQLFLNESSLSLSNSVSKHPFDIFTLKTRASLKTPIKFAEKTSNGWKDANKGYSIDKSYERTIEKEEKKSSFNSTRAVRASGAQIDRSGVYYFKSSGFGVSWLIGTDTYSNYDETWNFANAFKNGISDCPPDLTIPSSLTDSNGNTKPVEIIGQYAFYACADKDYNGKTRKLTLTKQVKVIKNAGLGWMDDLEEFVLEEGSVLETVEYRGLSWIGLYPGKTEGKRVTLTLPSTLHSVHENGILNCNLFHTIIYCGSHPLTNSSSLENVNKITVVKVSTIYPSGEKILGRTPDRNSQAEVQEECRRISGIQVQGTYGCSPAKRVSTLLLLFCLLV